MHRVLSIGIVLAGLVLTFAAPAWAQGTASTQTPPSSPEEMRELVEAARATAKATRESVEYGRVVPDILTQILAKLDKLENKLDKIENLLAEKPAAARRR